MVVAPAYDWPLCGGGGGKEGPEQPLQQVLRVLPPVPDTEQAITGGCSSLV